MTTASWLCSAGRNTVHPPPAARRQTVRGGGGGARNSDVDSKPGLTKLLPAEFTPNPPWADQIPSSFPATDGHKVSREIPSANPSYP